MRTAAAADQCTIHEPLFTYVAIVTIHNLEIFFTVNIQYSEVEPPEPLPQQPILLFATP